MGATAWRAQDAKAPAVRRPDGAGHAGGERRGPRGRGDGNAAPEARGEAGREARGAGRHQAGRGEARLAAGPGATTTAGKPAAPKAAGARPDARPSASRVAARPGVAGRGRAPGRHVLGRGRRRRAAAPAPAGNARFTRFRSTRDSLAGESARRAAERGTGCAWSCSSTPASWRCSTAPTRSWWRRWPSAATPRSATARAPGASTRPRGARTVKRKNENPVWIPPDWHYVEVAARKGLKLAYLPAGKPVAIGGGRSLAVRGGLAGVLEGKRFTALPTDEEIVFGSTLYVPPLGSKNRQIEGELGRFRLDLGDGYQLHGTPHEDTIGDAATHGCIRLYDEDIEWLYQHVPLGTRVFIF
jgi:hypothetical protein